MDYLKKYKPFAKPFLVVFCIYILALFSILRSGVSFSDDIERAVFGHAWNNDFSRYSSSLIGYLLNTRTSLMDISPLPQLVAVGILSISSIIFTYIFCNKKIKYLPLICSVFIGLQPFAIECWLYKFDAPCMAVSILVSIIPFLFWPQEGRKGKFFVISLLCLLIMWTTFQASSSIYILMCIFMATKNLINEKKYKDVAKNILLSAFVYIIAACIFKFCIPATGGYREQEIIPLTNIVSGVLQNIQNYTSFILNNSTKLWKILVVTILILFYVKIIFSKDKKIKTTLIIVIASIMSFVLSLGVYIVLDKMPLNGRTFIGFGALIAIVAVYITNEGYNTKIKYAICALPIVLIYSITVFCLALGNGLKDQEKYGQFRTEQMLNDLLVVDENASKKVQVIGAIGYSGVMEHVADLYPLTKIIVTDQQVGLSLGQYGIARARYYYGNNRKFVGVWEEQFDCEDMTTEIDNIYHIIKMFDDKICVEVKR